MRISSLAAMLALSVCAATLDAQQRPDSGAVTHDARLEARLPADARAGVRTVIDTARARGDEMFAHALDQEPLWAGKEYSQNYRWSFDFVRSRYGIQ